MDEHACDLAFEAEDDAIERVAFLPAVESVPAATPLLSVASTVALMSSLLGVPRLSVADPLSVTLGGEANAAAAAAIAQAASGSVRRVALPCSGSLCRQ